MKLTTLAAVLLTMFVLAAVVLITHAGGGAVLNGFPGYLLMAVQAFALLIYDSPMFERLFCKALEHLPFLGGRKSDGGPTG